MKDLGLLSHIDPCHPPTIFSTEVAGALGKSQVLLMCGPNTKLPCLIHKEASAWSFLLDRTANYGPILIGLKEESGLRYSIHLFSGSVYSPVQSTSQSSSRPPSTASSLSERRVATSSETRTDRNAVRRDEHVAPRWCGVEPPVRWTGHDGTLDVDGAWCLAIQR